MNLSDAHSASRTRPYSRAPRFCAKIGPIAPDSAKISPNATGVTRSIVAWPATAAAPNCAIACVTKPTATGVARFVSTAGAATALSRRACAPSCARSNRPSSGA